MIAQSLDLSSLRKALKSFEESISVFDEYRVHSSDEALVKTLRQA